MSRGHLAAAGLVALVVLVGVTIHSRGDGLNRDEQRVRAERHWRAAMIDSLEQDGRGKYAIDRVSCVHEQDGRFACDGSASRSYSGVSVEPSSSNPNKSFGRSTFVSEGNMLMGVIYCDENGCTSEPTG